eukprot:7389909-Prymnesium_polylepis.1
MGGSDLMSKGVIRQTTHTRLMLSISQTHPHRPTPVRSAHPTDGTWETRAVGQRNPRASGWGSPGRGQRPRLTSGRSACASPLPLGLVLLREEDAVALDARPACARGTRRHGEALKQGRLRGSGGRARVPQTTRQRPAVARTADRGMCVCVRDWWGGARAHRVGTSQREGVRGRAFEG